jgi:hypothetical protein
MWLRSPALLITPDTNGSLNLTEDANSLPASDEPERRAPWADNLVIAPSHPIASLNWWLPALFFCESRGECWRPSQPQ